MNLWEAAVSVYVLSVVFMGVSTAMTEVVHWRTVEQQEAGAASCADRAAEQWLRGVQPASVPDSGCVIDVQVQDRGWTRIEARQGEGSQVLWLESAAQG